LEELFIDFLRWFNLLVISYYGIANGVYGLLLVISVFVVLRQQKRIKYGSYQETIHLSTAPPVSILISAYNEENTVANTLKALLHIKYPLYELIAINDGSSDATLEKLIEAFSLKRIDLIYRDTLKTAAVRGFYANPEYPNLTVIDKAHSGKGDSLNAGINVSRSPYFCTIDADSILDEEAIMRLMRPIVENPDLVKAAGGIVRLANGSTVTDGRVVKLKLPKDTLSRMQIVEYIRSFLFCCTAWGAMNCLSIISGTFAMFHKKTTIDIGGFSLDTVTEDLDLVMRFHRHFLEKKERYRLMFIPDPICWTEGPLTLKMLARQRRRWHLGLAQSMAKHIKMLFNPFYGRYGLFGYPFQFFIEMLGPLVEIAGYVVVTACFIYGIVGLEFYILFLTMSVFLSVILSVGAILLEEFTFRRYKKISELLTLMLFGVLENFGYRQINAFWRLQALFKFVFRSKNWELVEKSGFESMERGLDEERSV
jgi:cellulose synthase/poly-beta-1,6-N-acetylglucosamine synthase-like glycosyltransferase